MVTGNCARRASRFAMMFFLMFSVIASIAGSPEGASAAPTFRLPWQKGSVWKITTGNGTGEHSNTANYYAFDAAPVSGRGTDLVTTVADGVVWDFQESIPNSALFAGPHAGNCVIIQHSDGLYSIYAHLAQDSVPLTKGQTITSGTVIGQMGDTGYASGKHLHWSVGVKPRMYYQYGYTTCAMDTRESRYADADAELIQDGGLPRSGRLYESFNPGQSSPKPSCTSTPLRAITSLSVLPTNPKVGESVKATFKVRNIEACDWVAHWLGVGGRGPGGDQDYQDFKLYDPLPIAAGGEYSYSETRTFDKPGHFTFFVYSQNSEIIADSASIVRTAAIDVAPCDPNVSLSKAITFTPNPAIVGDSVNMSVTVTNTGCAEFRTTKLWIDFYAPATDIVIPPGGSYTYTGESKVDRAADYEAVVFYQNAAGSTVKINGSGSVPSSTVLHVTTPLPTNTPTPTVTATATNTATATPSPTSTATPEPSATFTATASPTATNSPIPTATNTVIPTATMTPIPTETASESELPRPR